MQNIPTFFKCQVSANSQLSVYKKIKRMIYKTPKRLHKDNNVNDNVHAGMCVCAYYDFAFFAWQSNLICLYG